MKLKALFEKLAKKAGVDISTDEFKAIVIPDVDVPDDTAGGMEKGLLNLEAAKNHADIRKAIRTETLNGVDKKVADLLEELGIETADDVKNETNSFEKISKLTKLVQSTEAAKSKSNNKLDKDGYDQQIKDLNLAIKTLKEGAVAKETEFKTTREADLTNFELQSILMGKDFALPKEMGSKLKLSTAKAAVDEILQSKGFKIIRSENGSLAIVDKEGKPAYNAATNEPIELGNFIDGALAQNKLLKVNDPAAPAPGNNGHQPVTTGAGQQTPPANFQQGITQLDAMIAEAAKA